MPKRYGRKLHNDCTKVVRTIDSSSEPPATVSSYFVEPNSGDLNQNNGCETVNVMVDNIRGSEEKIDSLEEREPNRLKSLMRNAGVTGDVQSSGRSVAEGSRLSEDFYDQDSVALAKALLGQVVVRVVEGTRISGIIVETESYLGGPDVASHSYNGKRTTRTEAMYMKPGTSYVYSIYGMYYCFNISSQGDGSCVLIRALEPLEGFQKMEASRNQRRRKSSPLKIHELCNGPSKICQALYLAKDTSNKVDLATSDTFWLEHGKFISEDQVIVTKRVGIDSCGEEWANKPLRFYVCNNKCVSVRDKKAENNLKCN